MKILLITLEKYLGFLDTGMIHTYPVLKELGHDVLVYDYFINKSNKLIDYCNEFNPDLLFCCLAEKEINPEHLLVIKDSMKINSLMFACDCVWRSDTYFSDYAGTVNYFITTQLDKVSYYKNKYKNLKDVFHETLWVNDKFFYPIKGMKKEFAVSFVGRFHAGRAELFSEMKRKGINISFFAGITDYNEMNLIYNKSKIVFCPSLSSDCKNRQDKLRFYEAAASGTCFASDYDFGSNGNSFENNIDCITSLDKNELFDKIKHYLNNEKEREAISLNGYNKFKKTHTSKIKLNRILERSV